ncbi:MAG: polysaccharide deacetylase [Clostridiales bacterium]|jgi:peptidoglycan/xylan/chitin deacetylase (PgdA/CDA1 family)|nr:polysaccharide deacetylase [Eubacteriales bacterium]MDH7566046.1 polysaccharide deacetylase [Clostridiales bacterium]
MENERIKWPDDARCAVMLSFDVDGETTWANGNRGFEGGNNFIRSLSIGQYETRRCIRRILDLLGKYGIKGTFYVPGWVAERNEPMIREIFSHGHELGHHGYTHERFYDKTYEEQAEIIDRSQEIFKKITGKAATGFRTPSGDWAEGTPGLLVKKGFKYSSSMRGDDRPYRTEFEGQESDFIEIPTRWELDDYVQMAYNLYPAEPVGQDRISGYDNVLDNFIREFDGYYRYGLCCAFMMHPQVIGTPGRILLLERLIRHIQSHPDVWIATGEQIADWWRENY